MESSILDNNVNLGLKPKWRKTNVLRELKLAARTGVKGKNCWKLYPHCPQLEKIVSQTTNATSTSAILLNAGFPLTF